ncbi:hypothetical protein [Mucilaginibacter jinjuensis]|uniref:Uncharacterized protein n=1 Tax=Mucilaginibacter jinjuensis TaxID=1176721 RepID=A0ABY7T9S1_9SPHI|nr:hypothetical protein [Mucilaginibacter jinjuensis]WCT12488.1 hypothetical protein PQO05_00905 [Mucilaginibacter jinjuensis]
MPGILTSKPSEIREFSMAYEVDKLVKMLKLPITHVEFDERYEYGKLYLDENQEFIIIYARLFVNDDFIGTIPYISDKWGPGYDTSKQNELAWGKVYQQFQPIIFDKILQLEPLTATLETIENRSLLIKNKDGLAINTAYCNYINNEWNVVLGGLYSEERVKVFTYKITIPDLDHDEGEAF